MVWETITPRLDIVREISDEDETGAIEPLVEFNWKDRNDNGDERAVPQVTEELVVINSNGNRREWTSMKQSVAWLYCAAAVRRYFRTKKKIKTDNDRAERWTTMIVNISHEISIHSQLRTFIQNYISHVSEEERARKNLLNSCENLWREETNRLTPERFREQCGGAFDGVPDDWYPAWEDMKTHLEWFLQNKEHVHVVEMNSTLDGRSVQTGYASGELNGIRLPEDHIWIVCGGNTISRGLTLDGLVVSYFDRIADGSCVDTITQMGRWFGYRLGYELLPRVWMTNAANAEMVNIAAIEHDLHQELERRFERGCSPKNPDEFACVKFLGRRLTGRDSAMEVFGRSGFCDYFGRLHTTGCLATDPEGMVNGVCQCLDGWRENRFATDNDNIANFSWQIENRRPCPYYRNISWQQIAGLLQFVKRYYASDDMCAIENLIRAIGESETVWDVAVENPGRPRDNRPICRANGFSVAYSVLQATPREGVLSVKTQSYAAWFADVENAKIKDAECQLAEEYINGRGGGQWREIRKEIDAVRANGDLNARMSLATRRTLGIEKGSTERYRAAVFGAAGKVNPVLHLTFAEVTSENDQRVHVVLVAYYWPKHHVDAVARPGTIGNMQYGASMSEVCDVVRRMINQAHVTTVASIRDEVLRQYGAAELADARVRQGIRQCADLCAILEVPEIERGGVIRTNQVVYGTRMFQQNQEHNTLGLIRRFMAQKVREHFAEKLQGDCPTLRLDDMYEYLRESFPEGISENNVAVLLWQNPWYNVFREVGILAAI